MWEIIKYENNSSASQFGSSQHVLMPKLKGQVVSDVKQLKNVRTLAIGDGANDVAMIQSADVGIGIFGNEGRQASMNADFAIPKFSMLKRLMFVHGHWCYERAIALVLYFMIKHTSLGLMAGWYVFYAGFFTVICFDDMLFLHDGNKT